MPFLSNKTPMTDGRTPEYDIHIRSFWRPNGMDNTGATLSGALNIRLRYDNTMASEAYAEDVDGAATLATADARVQDLLNRLSAALDGSDWDYVSSERTVTTHRAFTPDEEE